MFFFFFICQLVYFFPLLRLLPVVQRITRKSFACRSSLSGTRGWRSCETPHPRGIDRRPTGDRHYASIRTNDTATASFTSLYLLPSSRQRESHDGFSASMFTCRWNSRATEKTRLRRRRLADAGTEHQPPPVTRRGSRETAEREYVHRTPNV
mgnify:CR=1 FL=1